MKTFETEFPSLYREMFMMKPRIQNEFCISQKEVIEFCLDKAKVREAIEKIISDKDLVTLELKYRIKELLKELGL